MASGKPLPRLSEVNLEGNLIKNGNFQSFSSWTKYYKSNKKDNHTIEDQPNYVIWERSGSGSDGGTLSLSQEINHDVKKYSSLMLQFDVWIDYHTLKGRGKHAKESNKIGELPVMIVVKYQGVDNKSHALILGFLTESSGVHNVGLCDNVLKIPSKEWHNKKLDLMNDATRIDHLGNILPKPKYLLRFQVMGKGWDFRAAVGNIRLAQASFVSTQPKTPSKKSSAHNTKSGEFKYNRAYIDGSNVAYGNDSSERGLKPSVSNIELVRNELLKMGFDDISTIVDASLRHKIDDIDKLENLIREGIVSQAPAGTQADEFILEFSKDRPGFIVTNDKLAEWKESDPWVMKNADDMRVKFMIHNGLVKFSGLH
jgi:hypothetical protein